MKITEINNKHYQQVEIMMLDTINETPLGLYNKKLYGSEFGSKADNWKSQHLYFISDEEINNEEFVINGYYEVVKLISKDKGYVECLRVSDKMQITGGFLPKKIIATTDKINTHPNTTDSYRTSNSLPQIPQIFINNYIETYNSGNTIFKALIEIEKTNLRPDNSMGYFEEGAYTFDWQIKLNERNEVITLI
jgi:hypothetical protein